MSYLSATFRKASLGVAAAIGAFAAWRSPPIFRATYHKQPSKVTELIEAGGDPNQPGWTGMLPIQRASFSGHAETLSALLKGGADPNKVTDSMNIPAISLAAFNGRADAVRLLLASGADPLLPDGDGDCPMDYLRGSPCCSKDIAEEIKDALSEAIRQKLLSPVAHSNHAPR